ncbi:ABC transporter G family member 22 (ABC transporter ABCG.22) [Durusdinium trenchii]|uniref:ABC transporter G family member 22 (ABC transporter ABCG.22) n=1 Tax=Durusdinium trenchii TaxID=1381693 RepID=A0ABP0RHY4_9DINO
MELEFRNVHYAVQPKGKKKEPLHILKGVSGRMQAGRLFACLGQSGSGKSTLLDTLAMRKMTGVWTGDILLDGSPVPMDNRWKRITGYVLQQDRLLSTSTVFETLMFSIQLRTPYGTPYEEHKRRVDEILEEMGLAHRRDARIGNEESKSLSGGEIRRVTIAQELVADVKVLFMDEPTSGLDSATANAIMKLLSDVAKSKNKIVAATVHQPSSQICELFDDMMLLSHGEVAYFGPWSEAVQHFDRIGFPCPTYTNPTDFLMDLTTKPEARAVMVEHGAGLMEERTMSQIQALQEQPDATANNFVTPFWFQFKILWIRAFRRWKRDELVLISELVQYVVCGLFIGAMYHSFPDTLEEGSFDRLSALFFILTTLVFIPSFTVITMAGEEKPLFKREANSGMYRVSANFLAKLCTNWPFELLLAFIFIVCCYHLCGFQPQASRFFSMYGILAIFLLLSETIGLICATTTPNPTVGVLVLSIVLLFALALGGFLVSQPRSYYEWFEYINFFVYGLVATIRVEFEDLTLFVGNVPVDALQALEQSGRVRNDLSVGENVAVLVGMLVAFRFSALLLLERQLRGSTFKKAPTNHPYFSHMADGDSKNNKVKLGTEPPPRLGTSGGRRCAMAGFSVSALEGKLGRLVNSQDAIQSASRWIAKHKADAATSIAVWEEVFQREPAKRLLLLYVANDVIQTTKRSAGSYFVDRFFDTLLRAVVTAMGSGDKTLVAKIERMQKLWADRKILDAGQLAEMKRAVRRKTATSGEAGREAGPGAAPALGEAEPSPVEDDQVATSDEESAADDPAASLVMAMQLIRTGDSLELENRGLDGAQADLLEKIEGSELEGVGDDLAKEKLERLKFVLDCFESNEDVIRSRDMDDPQKQDEKLYETVLAEERLVLRFADAAEMLEEASHRMLQSEKRDQDMSETLEAAMDDTGVVIESFVKLEQDQRAQRKRLRALARALFAENSARKRKREEETRRRRAEEMEERRKREAEQEAQRKAGVSEEDASAVATDFLRSFTVPLAVNNAAQQPDPRRPQGTILREERLAIVSAKGLTCECESGLARGLTSVSAKVHPQFEFATCGVIQDLLPGPRQGTAGQTDSAPPDLKRFGTSEREAGEGQGTMLVFGGQVTPTVAVLGGSVLWSAVMLLGILQTVNGNWEGWAKATCLLDGRCFCEKPRENTLVMQPANTWSNLAMTVAGVLTLCEAVEQRLAARKKVHTVDDKLGEAFAALFGVANVVLGLGSAWYHASLTFYGQWVDNAGMYLLVSAPMLFALAQLRLARARTQGLKIAESDSHVTRMVFEWVMINAILGYLCLAFPVTRRYIFAGLVLAGVAAEVLARKEAPAHGGASIKWFLASLATFALAFAIWTADIKGWICYEDSLWQGHAAWHVLDGIASFFIFAYYHPIIYSKSKSDAVSGGSAAAACTIV